jgi:SagB-type dehydrogenase family enzyme
VLDPDDTRTLALLFHLNSEPWGGGAWADEEQAYEIEYRHVPGAEGRVTLPPAGERDGLLRILSRRKSERAFAATTMALADLAEILAGSYGLGRTVSFQGGLEARARPVPSAGALFPLELYVVASQIEATRDGLYHYDILDHALDRMRTDLEPGLLDQAMIAAPLVRNANAVVFLSAVFDRTLRKYGARGYRYILFEAGHVAQNLCLLATERGLASLCVGGFIDARINRLLELEPQTEAVVYCVAIGTAADEGAAEAQPAGSGDSSDPG